MRAKELQEHFKSQEGEGEELSNIQEFAFSSEITEWTSFVFEISDKLNMAAGEAVKQDQAMNI